MKVVVSGEVPDVRNVLPWLIHTQKYIDGHLLVSICK
jgi:hypothetical protein